MSQNIELFLKKNYFYFMGNCVKYEKIYFLKYL